MPLGEFQEDLYVGDSLPLSGASSTLEVATMRRVSLNGQADRRTHGFEGWL
jgi:hypothetical protein